MRISSTISCGRLDAHVGLDQHLEQLVEKRVVDQPAFALEQVADVGVEQLAWSFCRPCLNLSNKPIGTVFVERLTDCCGRQALARYWVAPGSVFRPAFVAGQEPVERCR